MQGGRWFSKHPKSSVSRELVHTLAEYSLAKGARYLMVEMKDHATARLEELQIQFVVLHGLKPYTEHIPTTGRTYYSTPPLPRPAFAHLESLLITPTLHLLNM